MAFFKPGTQKITAYFRLAEFGNGMAQRGAIEVANKQNLIIAPNPEFDRRLVLTDTWKGEKGFYPAWTGTFIACAKPGQGLEPYVLYTDHETNTSYRFAVPKDYLGMKDVALALNHGFSNGMPIIVPHDDGPNAVFMEISDPAKISVLHAFPATRHLHAKSNEFAIPCGSRTSGQQGGYLYRISDYVGLVARDYPGNFCGFNVLRRAVVAYGLPSLRLGVLVESN